MELFPPTITFFHRPAPEAVVRLGFFTTAHTLPADQGNQTTNPSCSPLRHRVEMSRHHRVDYLVAVSDGFLMRAIPGCGLYGRGAFAPMVGIVIAAGRVVVATRDQVDRAFRLLRARRDPVRGASRVVGSALPGVHRPNAGVVRRVRGVSANRVRSLPKTWIEIGEFAPHHTSQKSFRS